MVFVGFLWQVIFWFLLPGSFDIVISADVGRSLLSQSLCAGDGLGTFQ
jgi:hypothetical protein